MEESFDYEFSKAGERVRFSMGIPYVQSNFDEFMAAEGASPYLKRSVLTQSRKGRAVEFLQVGKPGPGKRAMLVTARHHACEALASYVLEGLLREVLSESPAAVRFRATHVLYVVPFVDKDGVEDGDQGKDRSPHDHNRDYGDAPMYPEVKAIQKWTTAHPVQFALDLHCPALKGDIHEVFHFLGLGVPHVKDNLDEWIAWIGEEKPPLLMSPLDFLVDSAKPNAVNPAINSHHFATQPGILMAATLESPYTQPKTPLDADMARAYGAGLLKALNRPEWITSAPGSTRAVKHSDLEDFRKSFALIYRSKPAEAEVLAKRYLDDTQAAAIYRVEANNLMALLRFHQKRYAESLTYTAAVLQNGEAMTSQLVAAHGQRVKCLAADAKTEPADFEASLAKALEIPYLSLAQRAALFTAAADFYESRQEYEKALADVRQLVPVAPEYEKGKALNRIAAIYDLEKQPEKALATRQEAAALLRKQLSPVPQRSVFGATMALELFDTVMAIPTSTAEEKQAAADLVLNHDVVTAAAKEKVRKAMTKP
jgi:tetratricopeptide (TPR) repeat protein